MPHASAEAVATLYQEYLAGSVETVADDLARYAALLERWQRVQNLVSRETLRELWTRHISDSLQLLPLLNPGEREFLDLGSGGGLPALPLAIARRGDASSRFVLVEPNGRKASFLRTVARELGLNVVVLDRRAEQIDSRETMPQVITSRALAPMPVLCGLAAPFFTTANRALFHKGREHVEEIAETRAHWDFDVLIIPSRIGGDGVLLDVRRLRAKSTG